MNLPEQSSATSSYSKLKTDLLGCMDEMLGIENIRGCACEDLKEKVRSNAFNLVVVGQLSAARQPHYISQRRFLEFACLQAYRLESRLQFLLSLASCA